MPFRAIGPDDNILITTAIVRRGRQMKILIVDDNVAIQEIVRDILVEEGHNVRVARTVDEAVAKAVAFEPDAIILDSLVGDEDGLHMLTILKDEAPRLKSKIILLKSPAELAPNDEPMIRACVDKPFKSTDITAALKEIQDEPSDEDVPEDKKNRRKKSGRFRLFSKKKRDASAVSMEGDLQDHGVSFGTSYILFGRDSETLYGFAGLFDFNWYDVIVITTDRSKVVKERFSYGNVDVITLTDNGKAGTQAIRDLGTITDRIRGFIDGHDRPVIVFDRFDDVIEADGLNQSMLMIHQLMAGKTKMCTFVVSVDSRSLTEKDRKLFLHNMVEYKED